MDKLLIPVIEGTTRPNRQSIKVAKFITETGNTLDNVETFLVDPLDYNLPYDGNDTEVKDPKYTDITKRADAFFIVTPEYNHSFPGTLKRILDSELKNYIHKPVSLAGVSSGRWGGVRAVQSLVPTLREMGMVATFSDVFFPNVKDLFDEEGKIKDENYADMVKESFEELIWLATLLKWGRKNLPNKHHGK